MAETTPVRPRIFAHSSLSVYASLLLKDKLFIMFSNTAIFITTQPFIARKLSFSHFYLCDKYALFVKIK